MRRSQWSLQEAKNQFSMVVKAAKNRPQTVTKHGKAAVVIVAADEYARLKELEIGKPMSFKEMLLAIPRNGEPFERVDIELRDIEF